MIPSLLQIPSAVSDSKLHSVLPNNGKGDFTFDRSTGATRINKDGLIEEVGYFSSELVQNGNFSELGSEALINGDFATDSDWSKGTGWVIMNGYAESDGTNAPLDQVSRLTVGKTYKVVITVTNMTSSALSVRLGTSSSNAVLSILENGTYTAYGVAGATTFRLRSQGFDGRIQNVSVKQVDPNDRWSAKSGVIVSADSSGLVFDNSTGNYAGGVFQNIGLEDGKTYKMTATMQLLTGGSNGNFILLTSQANGTGQSSVYSGTTLVVGGDAVTNSFTFTPSTGDVSIQLSCNEANATYKISNISVVEVQGDRPRLSYDITNGVVEDKPHLLLEPSATNLITFSADFSQWSNNNSSTTVSTSEKSPLNTYATLLKENAVNQYHNINLAIADTNGATFSVLAKKINRDYLLFITGANTGVGAWFDLSDGTTTQVTGSWNNPKIQDMGNGWYLCSANYSTNIGTRFYLGSSDSLSNLQYQGTNNLEALYFGFAQVEATAYATSYIPTAGTTITRAAETCNNSKPSVNSTEGVLYCEIAALADDLTFRTISVSDGTTSNRSVLRYGGTSNFINVLASSGGSNVFDNNFTLSEITDFNKIAIKYKVNDYALWVNGNEVKTDTSGAAPVGLSQVQFSNAVGNSNIFYGKVKGLAVYNEALSESQLMQLTGVTASSIYNNFVTRTASFTVEALNEVKKVIDNL